MSKSDQNDRVSGVKQKQLTPWFKKAGSQERAQKGFKKAGSQERAQMGAN